MQSVNFWKVLLLFSFGILSSWPCSATVFYSKQEALQLAFGENTSVEVLSLFPNQSEIEQIESLAKSKLESKLISFHVGKKDGKVVGYAAIDSHPVRTQNETLLIVLDPAGELRNVHTLAFHEPPEYQAPKRWFESLLGHALERLSFEDDVQAVAGATLSTRAALASNRKVLSIFRVMLKPTAQP